MSSNPLNDLSQVYLDQVANVKKAENEADIQRWEEIGGPTPDNYKPTGGSAKIKTESTNRSDWRTDIFEAGDPDATQTTGFKKEKDSARKVKEVSGINNKVVINPKLNEAIKEIGGEVIVAEEVEEIDEDDQTRQQQLQRKQLMIDRQKLQLRRRAMGKKKKENNDGGSETEAQANVIANEAFVSRSALQKRAAQNEKARQALKKDAKDSGYTDMASEGAMTMIGKTKKKVEKKPEKAMDAGSRAKRMLARKIHAKYVSGSTENVPDDIAEAVKGQDTAMRKMAAQDRAAGIDKRLSPKEGRRSVKPVRYRYNEGEDKAFNFVRDKLKKKYGDGVMTTGEKMKPQSAADKAKVRAHQAKVDKENAAERAKDPSQGRYPKG